VWARFADEEVESEVRAERARIAAGLRATHHDNCSSWQLFEQAFLAFIEELEAK
jgi:hypothetical protein